MTQILNNAPVIFLEDAHLYFNAENGKELSGITSVLSRVLFPKQYAGVSKEVLDAAAKRGTAVHNACQFADMNGALPLSENNAEYLTAAKYYSARREALDLKPIAVEYLVSDLTDYASKIDCVYLRGDEVYICDIKTEGKLNVDKVTWQLCIYAYLFEKQNPGLHVAGLYVAHLPFESDTFARRKSKGLFEVQRVHDAAAVEDLLYVKAKEETPAVEEEEPASLPEFVTNEMVEEYATIRAEIDRLSERKKEIESAWFLGMETLGVKTFDAGALRVTYTGATTCNKFDAKRFEKDHPELYAEYLKASPVKASCRYTIRK